jgi:DHA1 family bicyclomycin/chloramphenicol resistance-like MFS transporter
VALGPLSIDMYLPAFPELARDLRTDPASVQRTLAAYFVGLALGQAFYGPLADRFGRKLPLYAGLAIFSLASAACALATSIDALIALRFVQALGGCAGMVIARAVVRDSFDERDSARVLSMLMLVMGLAPILAPVIGGWLVVHQGWRAIFWVLAGFGALNLVSVRLTLGETLPVERRQRHDLVTVLKVYGALLCDRPFMRSALAGGLIVAGMFAYIAGSPFVFMEIHGVSPEGYGLIFGANAAGLILASQVNGRLVMRMDRERLFRGALCAAAASGTLLFAAAVTGLGGFAGILVPLFVFIGSLGFTLPLAAALAMAPHGRNAGSASALIGVLQFTLGAVAGTAVGLLHEGSATPMTLIIAACGCGALLVRHLLARAGRGVTSL